MTKVLICGGRDYTDKENVFDILDVLHSEYEFELVIQGGARGADHLASLWATARNVPQQAFIAEWSKYGRSAGMKRNTRMLREGKPNLVVAFPGGVGTQNMVTIAKSARILLC